MWGKLFLISAVFSSQALADFFPNPQFSGEDVTTKMFGEGTDKSTDYFPIAYGDFNADKLTDIIAVSSDRASVVLFIAYEEAPFLRLGRICHFRSTEKIEIVGAAPGDFTGDGVMDLLVTLRREGLKSFEVNIFEGNSTDLICENKMTIGIDMAREPLVADLNGDMIMDLLGEEYVNNDKRNVHRHKAIWLFNGEHKLKPNRFDFVVGGEKKEAKKWEERYMIDPPSNSFVDVDGDTFPELVVITKEEEKAFVHVYEIVLTMTSVSFKYKEKPTALGQLKMVGQSIFVDFNRDGRLMHLLPYCLQQDCVNGEGLLQNNQGIKVIFGGNVTELPLMMTQFDNINWGFTKTENGSNQEQYYTRTIVLRVGDYNLDGFPDIIAVLEPKGIRGKSGIQNRAVIFENVPCKEDPEKVKVCPFARSFGPNFKVLSQYQNVTLATFFDIHEDGLIDVLIVRLTINVTNTEERHFELRAFQNSPVYDSNFLKVMVLTGRKCPKCPKLGVPFGNVIPGPLISYRTKTPAGELQTAVAAQNYRSSNMPMDLPYTIFGIGHSPSFVETLKISMSLDHDLENPRTHEWPQIIPNSQIIVIPDPLNEPKQWKAKFFLTPSAAGVLTFAVLMAICLVGAGIVVWLQVKEVREDRRESCRRREEERSE